MKGVLKNKQKSNSIPVHVSKETSKKLLSAQNLNPTPTCSNHSLPSFKVQSYKSRKDEDLSNKMPKQLNQFRPRSNFTQHTSLNGLLQCDICNEDIPNWKVFDHMIVRHPEKYSESMNKNRSDSCIDLESRKKQTATVTTEVTDEQVIKKLKHNKNEAYFTCLESGCGESLQGKKQESYKHLRIKHHEVYMRTWKDDRASKFRYFINRNFNSQ